jgi:outer membrane protein
MQALIQPVLSMSSSKKFPISLFLFTLTASMLSVGAHAAEPGDADHGAGEAGASHWGLGVGASLKKSSYKGISNNNLVVPLVSYDSKWVHFFGNTLDAKLPSIGEFDFALRTQLAWGEGYKASRSPYLDGMDHRGGSIYLGGASTWHASFAQMSLQYLKDVSGNSHGGQLKFGIERSFNVGRSCQITPHASVTNLDSKYVDYYYGVRQSEATSGRPAYEGKSTTETEVGVRLVYLLASNQRLILDVNDTHWGSGVSKSPLVDRTSTPGLLLGYTYAF